MADNTSSDQNFFDSLFGTGTYDSAVNPQASSVQAATDSSGMNTQGWLQSLGSLVTSGTNAAATILKASQPVNVPTTTEATSTLSTQKLLLYGAAGVAAIFALILIFKKK